MVWKFNLPHPTLAPFFQVKKLDFYCVPFLPVERVFDSTDPYHPWSYPHLQRVCTALRFNWTNWPMKLTPFYVAMFELGTSACPTFPPELTPCPTLPLELTPWLSQVLLFRFPASSHHACQHQHDGKRGTRKSLLDNTIISLQVQNTSPSIALLSFAWVQNTSPSIALPSCAGVQKYLPKHSTP